MEQLRAWGAQLASLLRETIVDLIGYVPGLLLALLLLVIGWLLARLVRHLTARAIEGLDWIFVHAAARSAEAAGRLQSATAKAVSTLLFWAILLSFVAAALRALGWPIVETWTETLVAYVPILVGGVLIILLGFIGGALARDVAESAATGVGIAHSAAIGRVTQAAVVVTGLVIGASELGLDVTFLVQLVTVVSGVTLAGFVLALALGTREHLTNLVGTRFLRKHYRVGDQIRVGEFEGRIIQIESGCVFLETKGGDVSLPGGSFSKEAFVKLDGGTTT